MPVVFTQGTVILTVSPHSISEQRKGKNKVVPIPDDNPITIPLGREGPTFKVEARLDATEYGHAKNIVQGDNVEVLSSTLDEFTGYTGDSFYVDDIRTSRKAGQNDEWDLMLQITRNFSA